MTSTALARPRMDLGTLTDPRELGTVLAASGYFADARDAAQAVVKVLAGAELGFGPIASMTGVYIVKGRVTLSANLMAAAIKRHPHYDYRVRTLTDEKAEVVFLDPRAKCRVCKGSGEVAPGKPCAECVGTGMLPFGSSEFTLEDAKRAGLAGGENWRKYPRNMLLWRAMSNGAKFYCPDAFSGAPVYTPDELGADVDAETGELIEIHPTPAPPAPTPEPLASARPNRHPEPPAMSTAERMAENDVTLRHGARPAEPTQTVAIPATTREDHVAAQPDSTKLPGENGNGSGDVSAPSAGTAVAASSDPPVQADPSSPVTEDEVAALRELLDAVGAPETFWRMALMSYNVDDLASLTRAQAREVMERATARFGSAR